MASCHSQLSGASLYTHYFMKVYLTANNIFVFQTIKDVLATDR